MEITELLEAATDDLSRAALAAKAYQLVARVASFNEIEIGGVGDYFGFKASEHGVSQELGVPDFLLAVGKLNPKADGVSGMFANIDNHGEGAEFIIIVDCVKGDLTAQSALKAMHTTTFMSVFKHEFIHLLDSIRGVRYKQPSSEDTAAYINSGPELNARFHDIANSWTSAYEEMKNTDDQDFRKDVADLYGVSGDFKTDAKNLMTANREARYFLKHLTPENQKRLLKRLYPIHSAIVALL